jgi:hypothetical protein
VLVVNVVRKPMEGFMMGFMINLMPYGGSGGGLRQHAVARGRSPTDLLIHVNEALNEDQRKKVVTVLEEIDGVLSAEFSPQRWHLLIVWYDTNFASSRALLDELSRQDLNVQLIGPL